MNPITHPVLVAALAKSGHDIVFSMTGERADLWHAATGISGEAGEICGVLFDFIDSEPLVLDMEHLTEELGDMEFYLQQLRSNIGVTREEVMELPVEFVVSNEPMVMSTALAIAASDVLDQVKKNAIYNKPLDRDALLSALALLEGALGVIRHLSGIEHETTLVHNIAKLSVRYAGLNYSDDAAQNRADKA